MCPRTIEATEDESTEIFRKNWQTYQQIITYNHLHHREVEAALTDELTAWAEARKGETRVSADRGCRVMDLGCGDAWLPVRLLSGAAASASLAPVGRFVGVDLSAPALKLAQHNAEAAGWGTSRCDWVLGDISEVASAAPPDSEKFDIIMSSFAIHHLKTKQAKAKILSGIYDCLAPGGLFLWADVYDRVGNGDRAELMALWKEKIVDGYHGIPQDGRDRIWDHASNHDWPETMPDVLRLLTGAGFQAKCIYHDDFYVAVWSGIKEA
jgi:SAM-dependent methyltransferase